MKSREDVKLSGGSLSIQPFEGSLFGPRVLWVLNAIRTDDGKR